ncbi:MAG: ATP phosphoribosyltransferase [Saprospiraceae bacterium]
MSKLRIAVQKKGRLSDKSLQLLRDCGIKISNGTNKLKAEASNFPLEVLYLRDDDIPQYVEQGIADIGILGENEVLEKRKNVRTVKSLGFSKCRMSLALPKGTDYPSLSYFNGKRVATSYPNVLEDFFKRNSITAEIEEISGSVEIAPGIGLADGILDIVSTGSTLLTNGLEEVEVILKSEAVLISNPALSEDKTEILEKLLFRIKAVQDAKSNKYILMNAPNAALDDIAKALPGMKSPSVLPLSIPGWSSIHSVVNEDDFWEVIDTLKALGAEGILVVPIEKMMA